MKVIRNMNLEELNSYMAGINISSIINWAKSYHSSSKGVCFWDIENEYQANTLFYPICAVFEIPDELLSESYGIYPDWNTVDENLVLKEYCIPSYSVENSKLLYWYWKGESKTKYNIA